MIVNLIKQERMFSLALPVKVKGQYWVTDIDSCGETRRLISIEAVDGEWIVKSNKKVSVLDSDMKPVLRQVIKPLDFFYLQAEGERDKFFLFAENVDESRQSFWKIVARGAGRYKIGRDEDSAIYFPNPYVSGQHAMLEYDGMVWSVCDMESHNGTYVNDFRIKPKDKHTLKAGDYIYIMGLKIIMGYGFFAVNNPDNSLAIRSQNLIRYTPQTKVEIEEEPEMEQKQFFFRSPRFHREIEHRIFKIDAPPQLPKQDTVPMALMLGPSLTMGMTSLGTGILTTSNVIANGGEITQALPTLIMSVSMLLGTVMWPVLTKKYEAKQKVRDEAKRQERYLRYLDQVRDDIKRACKEQGDILTENYISPADCAARIGEQKSSLWERLSGQSDFLRLRLGIGMLPLDAQIEYPEKKFSMEDDTLQDAMFSLGTEPKLVTNIPISISLEDNIAVGIYGSNADTENMFKSMILQMIALHGYDELKIILLTDEKGIKTWEYVRPIPHFWTDDKTVRFLSANDEELKEISAYMERNILSRGEEESGDDIPDIKPYYVIICTAKSIYERCSVLQKLAAYKKNMGFSVIFLETQLKDLPKETKVVISADKSDARLFDRGDTTGRYISFVPDDVSDKIMYDASRAIATIELDGGKQMYSLPSMVTFLEMFNVGKIEHLNSLTRWKENNPTKTLQTPVGFDTNGGLFTLDLHEKFHGPHGLVAGMTGSGKSEFVITYILSLAVNYHPDEVAFVLIDYKGGGLAGAFEDKERGIRLPHLAGTITNLDGAAVKRSLISIQSELRKRQAIFNEARKVANEGTMDIYKYQQLYRDKVVSEPVPHLFIISDEFAELKSQQPEFMEQLISTARIGRSLGVHLILATQKPSGVVDDQIWSNSKFRVCLKVQDKADSQEMIRCPDAAELSQTGRFYLQVGFNELFALGQSAWCGAEYVPAETVEKSVDRSVQVIDNLGRVVMNVKPGIKKNMLTVKTKQIVAIVRYLSDLAADEGVGVRKLWLDPIKECIFVDDLEKKYGYRADRFALNPVVGEYDDPFNQKQNILTLPFSQEGNCLIYGAAGNGKTTFLTTLCYSLLKHHDAREVNIYIMDFGSETLKVFENAPQVGGVVLSSDEEKLNNLMKLLTEEIQKRKAAFSEYGGDYAGYCKNSGKTVPNIVVLINNYSGFAEEYEDRLDDFAYITRECVKYGIYFAVTVGNTSAVRYKIQQNFRLMLTMQLNDPTDYAVVVGKTDGLIPSKYKGRGLVSLDCVYEFQTAYCMDADDMQDGLRQFVMELARMSGYRAMQIPVLPDIVDAGYFETDSNTYGLKNVPVGIAKASLKTVTVNLDNKLVLPIAAQEIQETVAFTEELIRVAAHMTAVKVIDAEKLISSEISGICEVITDKYEDAIVDLFNDMVERNNTYKDAGMDVASLDSYKNEVYVIVGLKKLFGLLSDDGKDKLRTLIEYGEAVYKLHFVMADSVGSYSEYAYDAWYKRHMTGSDGVWLGDGVADQYMFRINKVTSGLYEGVEGGYGYVFNRGSLTLSKVLSAVTDEEE